MRAFVLIEIRPGGIHEVVGNLRRMPGVIEVHSTFGPFDAVAKIEAETVAGLGRLVDVEIQCVPGVENTLTCLATDDG